MKVLVTKIETIEVTPENTLRIKIEEKVEKGKYTRKDGDDVYDLEEERAYERTERGHK
jgi:hypothetical protein